MRVMIDTNILISALLFTTSLPSKVVKKVLLEQELALCSHFVKDLYTFF